MFHLETEDYTINTYNKATKPGFKFFGGKGMVEIYLPGAINIHFKKTNEHISVSKPKGLVKNVIWGGIFVDLDGRVESINHETGSRIELDFIEKKSNTKNSCL